MQYKKVWNKIIWMLLGYGLALLLPALIVQAFRLHGAVAINLEVVLTAILTGLLLWIDRRTTREAGLPADKKITIGDWLVYGFTGLLLIYGAEILGTFLITALFGMPQTSQNTTQILKIIKSAPAFAIYAVILAPIMEELVFRKTIFGVGRRIINPIGAALISSLLFGLAHNDNRFLIIYSGIGLVLCWLYNRTGSIKVTMLAHALLNGITIALQLFLLK